MRLHASEQVLHFFKCFGVKLVVNPASILSVPDDSRILENSEMEGQTRLSGIQRIGELADAAFSFAEQLDDLESGLVGEGVKQLDRAFGSGVDCCSHGMNISK